MANGRRASSVSVSPAARVETLCFSLLYTGSHRPCPLKQADLHRSSPNQEYSKIFKNSNTTQFSCNSREKELSKLAKPHHGPWWNRAWGTLESLIRWIGWEEVEKIRNIFHFPHSQSENLGRKNCVGLDVRTVSWLVPGSDFAWFLYANWPYGEVWLKAHLCPGHINILFHC